MIKDKEFFKRILKIMIPVAIQLAINQGVNMMDTVMVGSLGELQLSGSSLANSFYNLFVILCLGIIGGSSVLAAQYWGAGNKKKVRETFSLAVLNNFSCFRDLRRAYIYYPGKNNAALFLGKRSNRLWREIS